MTHFTKLVLPIYKWMKLFFVVILHTYKYFSPTILHMYSTPCRRIVYLTLNFNVFQFSADNGPYESFIFFVSQFLLDQGVAQLVSFFFYGWVSHGSESFLQSTRMDFSSNLTNQHTTEMTK